jgi:hypothetical protein
LRPKRTANRVRPYGDRPPASKKRMKILAIVSDMHVNSAVGLFPPACRLDDQQHITPSESQRWLWRNWLDYWQTVERIATETKATSISAVFNGDWGDKNKHSGFQLLEPENDDVILDTMTAAVKPATQLCDNRIYVVRGTEAHTGGSGWLENRAAKDVNAQIDPRTGMPSFWVLRLQIDGVRILTAHHPMTNGRVKWTNGSAANRAAATVALEYYNEPQRPHLAVFSHVHHSEDSYDNQPVRVLYTPPWCLAGSFVHRIGAGLGATQVGSPIVLVDGDRYQVVKRYYKTPGEERQWLTI